MEEDDMVKSMAIASYRERRTDEEGRAASPRNYKEVPKDPFTPLYSYYYVVNYLYLYT